MEVTVRDIVLAQSATSNLAGIQLPPKKAWWFQKWIRKIDQNYRDYEVVRKSLVAKYSEDPQDGTPVQVSSKNRDAFVKDIEELLDQPVRIDVPQISLSELDGVKIEIGTIAALWFIFFDEEV